LTQKKNIRYVQTVAEMSSELMTRGLAGTRLHVLAPERAAAPAATNPKGDDGGQWEGDRLARLVEILGELEESLQILERRGLSVAAFLKRAGATGLPVYRVVLGGREQWFATSGEVDAFRRQEQQRLGCDLVVADESPEHGGGNGQTNGHNETFFVQEFHEVRGINRGLERLREFSLDATCLVEAPRIAGREPPLRFTLENGDLRRVLPHLRELVPEVRRLGERGLTITRFKGLGEMDGEELWETTLDPEKRMLMQVHLEDAFKADEMFRVLMGEKVEPRREFIQKHALEVKDIDYHGA
jgi:DNA gyrase subunit B